MGSFNDERDWVVQGVHVTHGHATQGRHREELPPYALYPPRCELMRLALGDKIAKGAAVRVFEYGALLGYFLMAAAGALLKDGARPVIGWCDNESTEPGSNERCRENLAAIGIDQPSVYTDRRETLAFRFADVVAVDGDHSYEATMDDLAYAMLLGPAIVFVDDLIPTHPGTTQATLEFSPFFKEAFRVPTVNNLGVLSKVPVKGLFAAAGWLIEDLRY